MTGADRGGLVVIGVGSAYRRDDAVGPAVAAEVARSAPPGVLVHVLDGEPTGLLEAWTGARLAVVVDALQARGTPERPIEPGRVHRTDLAGAEPVGGAASSHGLGVPEAFALGRALDRLPERLVVYAVEVADVRQGTELTPAVAAAVPLVAAAILAECRASRDAGPR
jgi:hydrogenase maturation protease